ncbi:single-stranded DNA-binding protein [Streptacidiphilus monticola]
MDQLHQQLAPALALANEDLASRPVIPAPRDGSARYADEELPTPLVLTGAVVQDVELRTAGGAPVARLLLAPDAPLEVDGVSVERLTCDLHGDQAVSAHASLATGAHVLLAGTVVRRHYTGADQIPRTAVTLTVQHIGHALT